MTAREGWAELTAVREANVFVVDANSYFARPGPRLIHGTEILARLLHPALFEWPLDTGIAFKLAPNSLDQFEPFH
jgi:iron complex transport system substrate-binding protein